MSSMIKPILPIRPTLALTDAIETVSVRDSGHTLPAVKLVKRMTRVADKVDSRVNSMKMACLSQYPSHKLTISGLTRSYEATLIYEGVAARKIIPIAGVRYQCHRKSTPSPHLLVTSYTVPADYLDVL